MSGYLSCSLTWSLTKLVFTLFMMLLKPVAIEENSCLYRIIFGTSFGNQRGIFCPNPDA